jgi:hypothetical protein
VTLTALPARGGGLAKAHRKGHLDGGGGPKVAWELYLTGCRYQQAYETMDPRRTANWEGGSGGGGHGDGPQLAAVEAGQLLQLLRRDQNDAQRDVLDLVCGQDMSLRQVQKLRGGRFETHQRHLRAGLEQAAKNVRGARKARTAGLPRPRAMLAGGA